MDNKNELKKKILSIIKLLTLGDDEYILMGSFNNPDFEYWSDVDVQYDVKVNEYFPQFLKQVLTNIKSNSKKMGIKFLELKTGIRPEKYFKANYIEDYEDRYNKKFDSLDEAKDYAKSQYVIKIKDIDISLNELRKSLKNPYIIKLDLLVKDFPNFTIEIVYNWKQSAIEPDNFNSIKIGEFMDEIEKYKKLGLWSKVVKRMYSISKEIGDEKLGKELAEILKPYAEDVWLIGTLEIPQSENWKKYVASKNIDFDEIQNNIKNEMINRYII